MAVTVLGRICKDVGGMYTVRLPHIDWCWCVRCFLNDPCFCIAEKIKEGLTRALNHCSLLQAPRRRVTHRTSVAAQCHTILNEMLKALEFLLLSPPLRPRFNLVLWHEQPQRKSERKEMKAREQRRTNERSSNHSVIPLESNTRHL